MAEEKIGTDTGWIQSDTLSTGFEAREELLAVVPAMCVTWIRWDSGFRGSGLAVNDRVIAVRGKRFTRPADAQALSRALPSMPGQYQEPAMWQAAGAKDGDEVELTLRRRVLPGDGWRELTVRGRVRLTRAWRDADNRPIFGPGGPEERGYDGSDNYDAWSSWYDRLRKLVERALDENANRGCANTASDLKELVAFEGRLTHLTQTHPGAFADAVKHDWELGVAALRGRAYTIADGDLAWRVATERLADDIATAGREARARFLQEHAAELIDAFPTVDPVLGERARFVGRLVELPRASNRDWILQGLGSRIVWEQGDGGYAVDPDAPPMQRALVARLRYERAVSPAVRDEYAIIGRVKPDPTFVLHGDRGCFALEVEPVAVTMGDAIFVDVTQGEGERAPFAGEETLAQNTLAPLPDDASPRAVLDWMVAALKAGDQARWITVFATVSVHFDTGGPPLVRSLGPPRLDSTWEWTRRMFAREVYDQRVVWVDDARAATTGREYEGAPVVEYVEALMDTVRRDDDGSYRAYVASGVQTWWTLQRIDGGPWRVVSGGGL